VTIAVKNTLLIFIVTQYRSIVIATVRIRQLFTGTRLLVRSGCGKVVTIGLRILDAGSRHKRKITIQLHVIYVGRDWRLMATGC
jgi:hypothetical protein